MALKLQRNPFSSLLTVISHARISLFSLPALENCRPPQRMLKIMVIVVTEGRFSCKICMIQTRFSNFILIIINHFKRLEEKQIRCPIFEIKTENSVPIRWEMVRHGFKAFKSHPARINVRCLSFKGMFQHLKDKYMYIQNHTKNSKNTAYSKLSLNIAN